MNVILKSKIIADLRRSRKHFEYSFNKVSAMRFDGPFDDEQLATLESFSSRFSRFSNLAIKQFLMFRACESDPGFRGSVIDLLNYAEKFNWIEPAAEWRRIRELRNLAHMNIRLRTFWDCIWSSLQKRQFLLC